jgi:hypothetical protein
MIITDFTTAHHLPLPWARQVQFIPHLISWIQSGPKNCIHSTHQYKGAVCILFLGHSVFILIHLPIYGKVLKEFPLSLPMSHQRISPRPRPLYVVWNMVKFLLQGTLRNSPNQQAGGPPIVGCHRLLILYIRNYFPYWRSFLLPQPEDTPCHDGGDPLITVSKDLQPLFHGQAVWRWRN